MAGDRIRLTRCNSTSIAFRMGTSASRPVRSKELVAVFDESGSTSAPGEQAHEDFVLAAVVFQGARAFSNLVELDCRLRVITSTDKYKYRQVRQSTLARRAVIETLQRQSDLIRVFGLYAAGGAFKQGAEKHLDAVRAFGGDSVQAEQNLACFQTDPYMQGLAYAAVSSIPAMSTFADARQQRIAVYSDRTNNLNFIATVVREFMLRAHETGRLGDKYSRMDWRGECPNWLEPVARIADIFAGDIRATFKAHGHNIWSQIKQHGFVNRHREVAESPDSLRSTFSVTPLVGFVKHEVWDSDWETESTTTTMFKGYLDFVLSERVSVVSPCGRFAMMVREDGGFRLYQGTD